MSKMGRVLVAMSGGIDSSVVAMLLHEEGYEVIGITMKTWDYANSAPSSKETGCCDLDSINDAREMATSFGFPHYIIDIRKEFGEKVIENFKSEYLAGRTPNPCILCNTHIKWEALLKHADTLDCEFIATGHYAKLKNENDRFFIQKGKDPEKDQAYVLWGLSQDCMSRSIFPIGDMVKSEVRAIAKEAGFTELSKKGESYEICFVPDNNYRGFLKEQIPTLESDIGKGSFIDVKGKVLGEHNGYPFYTVGQRKGLGIAMGVPVYVTHIDPVKNEVTLGEQGDLIRNGLVADQLNLMKYPELPQGQELVTKIRYRDAGTLSTLESIGPDKVNVVFLANVRGVAPGQSAVFYEGDDVLGGGIIKQSL